MDWGIERSKLTSAHIATILSLLIRGSHVTGWKRTFSLTDSSAEVMVHAVEMICLVRIPQTEPGSTSMTEERMSIFIESIIASEDFMMRFEVLFTRLYFILSSF